MKKLSTIAIAAVSTSIAAAGLVLAPSAASTASAATCHTYQVTRGGAPVRENPSSRSVIRKTKGVFEIVTGPCGPTIKDPHTPQYFVPVNSSACTDGVCWMATQLLEEI